MSEREVEGGRKPLEPGALRTTGSRDRAGLSRRRNRAGGRPLELAQWPHRWLCWMAVPARFLALRSWFLAAALFSAGLLTSDGVAARPGGRLAAQAAGTQAVPVSDGSSATPVAALRPALGQVRTALFALHVGKWKAPGPVRDQALANVDSLTRDLDGTLPGLLTQAEAAPRSVASGLIVYRNLDALYDVLLRVEGTAELAAPEDEAGLLSNALATLERSRRSYADTLLAASQAMEAAQKQAEARPVAVVAPPAPTPVKTIVNDGPAPAARKKARPKSQASTPAPQP